MQLTEENYFPQFIPTTSYLSFKRTLAIISHLVYKCSLLFSSPFLSHSAYASTFVRREASKRTSELPVFPLRFPTLHHPYELAGGMRKGGACAREETARRRLFSTPRVAT